MPTRGVVSALCLMVALTVVGCGSGGVRSTTPPGAESRSNSTIGKQDSFPSATSMPSSVARAELSSLVVKGRAPKTGYGRSKFGRAWNDDVSVAGGHNGCNTRIIYSPRPGLARFALVTVPASRHAVQPTEGGTIGTSLRVMR